MKRILCEISGGADSFLSTLYAMRKYPDAEFHGIFVDYGQAPLDIEYEKASEFCIKNSIKLHRIEIRGLFQTGTITGEKAPTTEVNTVASVYTPLRNLVIGACASSLAEQLKADEIIVGSKGLNKDGKPYSFGDSVVPFYVLLENVVNFAGYHPIKVNPILTEGRNIKMTKKEVYDELAYLGYTRDDFWNCFNAGPEPCGKCNNCIEYNELMTEL